MVKVAPKIGSAYGGYGVVLEIPGKGRTFGCTCVRVLRPEPGRVYEPTYALDLPWPHEMSQKVYNVFKRLGHHMECAIPWSDMPEVKARMDQDKTLKFSFRVNQGGEAFELAAGRSVSKDNSFAFHNDWATHWANELVFGVVAWQ